jgi:hypothetical protein
MWCHVRAFACSVGQLRGGGARGVPYGPVQGHHLAALLKGRQGVCAWAARNGFSHVSMCLMVWPACIWLLQMTKDNKARVNGIQS